MCKYLKIKLPHVKSVHYFSHGCGGQYKKFKNFVNLCKHKEDFGLSAVWTFFATSHGKSACDGIGGTVKRLATTASLQRPLNNQILSASALFECCEESMPNNKFAIIKQDEMLPMRKLHEQRFAECQTVPGTRSYQHIEPLTDVFGVQCKQTSEDVQFTTVFSFENHAKCIQTSSEIKSMDFIACCYDVHRWIGLVEEIDNDNQGAKVQFLHPHGPSTCFSWPARDDICWVPFTEMLYNIDSPTTSSGRVYNISSKDLDKINNVFDELKN